MREIGILSNQHIINVGGVRLFHSKFYILHSTFNWLFDAPPIGNAADCTSPPTQVGLGSAETRPVRF